MATLNFSIKQRSGEVAQASQDGMGAIPHTDGTAFRVWAPHANEVYVAGTFNDWSESATRLASEDNGYWSIDVPGAQPGDEYRYLILNGTQRLWRLDPYARELTNSEGNSIIHDPDFDWDTDNFQMPAWNELVIYEMHVGTFNAEPAGVPGNFHSVIEKLSHLKDLGVNAIQLMPPMEFAGESSWGYNPAHIFAVEHDYGGPRAFKELVKASHEHGIAVLVDVVYNHFGPGDLSLWQFDGWSENEGGGIYFYNDWRAETPWGNTRPDYGRDEVRQYIRDNVLMWLEDYRVDGLRWDATAFIRNVYGNETDPAHDLADGWSLMQWIHEEIQTRQPWKISIAEDLRENAWIIKDTGAGGAGFHAQWDSQFVHPIREAIIGREDDFRDMDAVAQAILHRYAEDAFTRVIYTESHDEVANGRARVPEEIWPGNIDNWFSKKRSTLGAALVFTAPGVPMIFQGQEFLEDRWFHDKDPLEWSRAEEFEGLAAMYRDMIRLRRNVDGHTSGLGGQNVDVHHVNDQDKVIAFHRWEEGRPGDSVIVVANLANRTYESYNIGFPTTGQWKVRFNSDWHGYDPGFDSERGYDTTAEEGEADGMPCNGNVGIGPYSVLILSQDS